MYIHFYEHLLISNAECFFSVLILSIFMFIFHNPTQSVFQHGITIVPRKEEQRRFFRYCFFGYGCPILLMLIIFLIDTTKIISDKYLPGLGSETCFIQNAGFAQAIYLKLPIAIIMVVNCVFYALTAFNIWWTQHHRQYVRIESEKAK